MKAFSGLPPLKQLASSYALPARKSLGQHFLLDEVITDRIAQTAGDLTIHNVIEIGPGPGGLTRSLLTSGAKTLFVIEKDARCIAFMQQLKEVVGERLYIIEGDALEVDLMRVIPAPRKIVANLPYNAGTAMLLKWLENIYRQGAEAFAAMTLMFQKEVAERITAAPGNKDYGRLSVISQWLCNCTFEFELPPEAFTPPPKVSSAVITLAPRKKLLFTVEKPILETVLAKAFGQRRKMLRQALKGLETPAEALLQKAGIDGTLRAEQLDIAAFGKLAKTYSDLLNS